MLFRLPRYRPSGATMWGLFAPVRKSNAQVGMARLSRDQLPESFDTQTTVALGTATWLVEHGFQWADSAVVLPGTFNRRGGILDVFPLDAEAPYRLEFFGDDIESIRQFSPQTNPLTSANCILMRICQRMLDARMTILPMELWGPTTKFMRTLTRAKATKSVWPSSDTRMWASPRY